MCTMHEVTEFIPNRGWIYPYRCSRCGGCFLCQHDLVGYEYWICHDGYEKPTQPDRGVDA